MSQARRVPINRIVVRVGVPTGGGDGLDRALTAALTARLRAAAPTGQRHRLPADAVAAQVAADIAGAVRRKRRRR